MEHAEKVRALHNFIFIFSRFCPRSAYLCLRPRDWAESHHCGPVLSSVSNPPAGSADKRQAYTVTEKKEQQDQRPCCSSNLYVGFCYATITPLVSGLNPAATKHALQSSTVEPYIPRRRNLYMVSSADNLNLDPDFRIKSSLKSGSR